MAISFRPRNRNHVVKRIETLSRKLQEIESALLSTSGLLVGLNRNDLAEELVTSRRNIIEVLRKVESVNSSISSPNGKPKE